MKMDHDLTEDFGGGRGITRRLDNIQRADLTDMWRTF